MSHYSAIETVFLDQECLVDALKKLGFPCETHKIAMNLFGYCGDMRPDVANIIVRRNHIYSASNDLGFLWDGKQFQVIISEYDQNYGNATPGHGLGRKFLPTLRQEYALAVATKTAIAKGFTIESVTKEKSGKYIINAVQNPQTVAQKRRK